MKYDHEVIFCIVNAGSSDAVMDAAREFGARGGTVMRARGTANPESEKYFHITVLKVFSNDYSNVASSLKRTTEGNLICILEVSAYGNTVCKSCDLNAKRL